MKHLVKLNSFSPLPRTATSTLCLQSRRTMSRHTRLLPGVYKWLPLTKSWLWENLSQRDSGPSACCSVGTRCYKHHQCGGGRLRRHHHLHPGGDYTLSIQVEISAYHIWCTWWTYQERVYDATLRWGVWGQMKRLECNSWQIATRVDQKGP